MFQNLKITALLICFSITLLGCASTSTSGQKLVNLDAPIKRMGILIQKPKFTNAPNARYSIGASVADDVLNALIPLLDSRTQRIFASNEIENRTVIEEIIGQPSPINGIKELDPYQFILVITPVTSSYRSYGGGVNIKMKTVILDRSTKKAIWNGSISVTKAGLGRIDETVADGFTKDLLIQLNNDGIIKLRNAEPNLPKF